MLKIADGAMRAQVVDLVPERDKDMHWTALMAACN